MKKMGAILKGIKKAMAVFVGLQMVLMPGQNMLVQTAFADININEESSNPLSAPTAEKPVETVTAEEKESASADSSLAAFSLDGGNPLSLPVQLKPLSENDVDANFANSVKAKYGQDVVFFSPSSVDEMDQIIKTMTEQGYVLAGYSTSEGVTIIPTESELKEESVRLLGGPEEDPRIVGAMGENPIDGNDPAPIQNETQGQDAGMKIDYYENGVASQIAQFDPNTGNLTSEQLFDESGNLVSMAIYDPSSGSVLEEYFWHEDGMLEIVQYEYDENGDLFNLTVHMEVDSFVIDSSSETTNEDDTSATMTTEEERTDTTAGTIDINPDGVDFNFIKPYPDQTITDENGNKTAEVSFYDNGAISSILEYDPATGEVKSESYLDLDGALAVRILFQGDLTHTFIADSETGNMKLLGEDGLPMDAPNNFFVGFPDPNEWFHEIYSKLFPYQKVPDSDGDSLNDEVEGRGWLTSKDTDGDGTPDYKDADSDNDGIPDVVELGGDRDRDGIEDFQDDDSDGDGISDKVEGLVDTDKDLLRDSIDKDSDNDGILDIDEGIGDRDGDGTPDFRDPDQMPKTTTRFEYDDKGQMFIITTDEKGVETRTGPFPSEPTGLVTKVILDSDGDGIPDASEGEKDEDYDNDGIANHLDPDADGDGYSDQQEGLDMFLDFFAHPEGDPIPFVRQLPKEDESLVADEEIENQPPIAREHRNPQVDLTGLTEPYEYRFTLANAFIEPDGDTLTFSTPSASKGTIIATENNTVWVLKIDPNTVVDGEMIYVSFQADDGNGHVVSNGFYLTIIKSEEDSSGPVDDVNNIPEDDLLVEVEYPDGPGVGEDPIQPEPDQEVVDSVPASPSPVEEINGLFNEDTDGDGIPDGMESVNNDDSEIGTIEAPAGESLDPEPLPQDFELPEMKDPEVPDVDDLEPPKDSPLDEVNDIVNDPKLMGENQQLLAFAKMKEEARQLGGGAAGSTSSSDRVSAYRQSLVAESVNYLKQKMSWRKKDRFKLTSDIV